MEPTTWILVGFLVLMFVCFYFLMVRPQRKRQQEHTLLASKIITGDRIITWAGIYGEVTSCDENTLVIKLESEATMRIARLSVAQKQLDTND